MAGDLKVERWSSSDLEQRLDSSKVLSRSSTSMVLLSRDSLKNREVVVKSYSSLKFGQITSERVYTSGTVGVLSGPSYFKPERSYFEKEAALLNVLSQSRIVPPIYAIVPENLSIVMGHVEGVAFSKKLLDIDNLPVNETFTLRDKEVKKNALRERLLDHLVEFYNQTEDLSDKARHGLSRYDHGGGKLIRYIVPSCSYLALRSSEEEDIRIRHYLLKLVYGGSEEFKNNHPQFYGVANIPPESHKRKEMWNQAKKDVKAYLNTKEINFNEFSQRFQQLYDDILFSEKDSKGNLQSLSLLNKLNSDKLLVIHGDFGPHNVLYSPGKLGTILDFNECRIASPQIDISLALFNLYSNPTESRVPRLIEYFWNNQKSVQRAYPSFPDFLAGCIATRVLQSLRIASCNFDYDSSDVERFVVGHPTFHGLLQKERDVRFKYDRIIELGETIPFYTIGDGFKLLEGAHPQRREKLVSFLEMARKLIYTSYIMPPLEKYRGKKI